MSATATIAERRAQSPPALVSTQARSVLWSLWQIAAMIGAPALGIVVPGALAYFAFETLGCTLMQL